MTKDQMRVEEIVNSDDSKYSQNLNAFLKKYLRKPFWSDLSLSVVASGDGSKFVGYFYDGSFIGVRMGEALTRGARSKTGSWVGSRNWKPIKGFWGKYKKIGVCAVDPDHSFYSQRWATNGTTRQCRFCGRVEKFKTEIVKVKRETWVAV